MTICGMIRVFCIVLSCWLVFGCGDGGGAADSGSDSGDDGGTDTDTGSGDYWDDGTCNGPDSPSSPDCNGVSFEGCCTTVNKLLRCVDDQLYCIQCFGGEDASCGWNAESSTYDCDYSGWDLSGEHLAGCPNECANVDCDASDRWFVDSDAPDGGDGLSWQTAVQMPGTAVTRAYRVGLCCGKTTQVWVAAGTYYLWQGQVPEWNYLSLKAGVEVYGGFAGDESSLDQRDWVANPTVLDGRDGPDGENRADHVVGASYPQTGDSGAVLDGFRISGGAATSTAGVDTPFGGGVLVEGSSPVFANCTFAGNEADYGGGAAVLGGSPAFTNCVFEDNIAAHGGGVLADDGSTPAFDRCVLADNAADFGGGIAAIDSSPTIVNCTFSNNEASEAGGAMVSAFALSQPVVVNSILWGNAPDQIFEMESAVTTVTYSDVQGGWLGAGNIDADPLFTDAPGGDLTLQSGSPCIDAADGDQCTSTCADDTTADDTGVGDPTYCDMGAFEFQL